MFNLKWCAVPGGGGFLLSFLVALISGAGFPALLVRPLVFGAAFFVLGGGIWLLVNRFVPDLLLPGEDPEENAPGSRVDISVGDQVSGALPAAGSNEDVDDIAKLASSVRPPPGAGSVSSEKGGGGNSPGLDQNDEGGYTEKGRGAAREAGAAMEDLPVYSGGPPSGEVLPDLESMTGSFLSGQKADGEGPENAAESWNAAGLDGDSPSGADEALPERRRTSGKGQSMGGDFNPKDLASAMRTLLSKD
ncbi:MAG: hypothetical protein LBL44_09175 [Treponema sp.]|nr:hypothetical protein [Treponema sp.]